MLKTRLSRDCAMLFETEIRNEDRGGETPSTIGSAYDSFLQAPGEVITSWLGYKKTYPYAPRANTELGIELRRLIRKHGKKTKLLDFKYIRENL